MPEDVDQSTTSKITEKWAGFPIGFASSLTSQGYKIETQVLKLEVISPSENITHELNLGATEKVVELHRLRIISQEPLLIALSYLSLKLVPDIIEADFTQISLYQTFETKYDLEITKVKHSIEAVAASEEDARLLKVEPGSPLLQIEGTSYLPDGTPIEYFVTRRKGERTRFEFEVSKPYHLGSVYM